MTISAIYASGNTDNIVKSTGVEYTENVGWGRGRGTKRHLICVCVCVCVWRVVPSRRCLFLGLGRKESLGRRPAKLLAERLHMHLELLRVLLVLHLHIPLGPAVAAIRHKEPRIPSMHHIHLGVI